MINPLDWDLGNVPPGVAWGGVDEAGRGAWAGPVVAACAVLDTETVRKWGHVLRNVRDSKKLTAERRGVLAAELKAILPAYGIAEVDAMGIDRENILEATLMAMRQSVANLALRPRLLFIDGNRGPRTGLPERLVVDGDALSCAIGAASILAKAHRDALLIALEETTWLRLWSAQGLRHGPAQGPAPGTGREPRPPHQLRAGGGPAAGG